LLFLALLLDHGFATGLAAQTRTNLAGSVTSETMTVLWVARDRGLFKNHGLDMQFILMPRNPLAIAALLAGEIDAAIVGPGHVINAASSGVDVIGIANLKQKLDYRLAARPEIKTKEELRGKRIGVSGPGSTSHLQALLALQDLNVDLVRSKVAFITIPGTEINRRLALETGGIDVTALTGSVGDLYGNKGYTVLYNSKNTGATLPQTMLGDDAPDCSRQTSRYRRVPENFRGSHRGDRRSGEQRISDAITNDESTIGQFSRCGGGVSFSNQFIRASTTHQRCRHEAAADADGADHSEARRRSGRNRSRHFFYEQARIVGLHSEPLQEKLTARESLSPASASFLP
jgi:hypothetical protein